MQISIANAIQVARRIGAAAAKIITTNLKMWLGFETSETIGKNIYDGGIIFGANGGTFTDNGNGTFTVTGDGSPNLGIGVRDFDADYLTVGDTYKFSTQGANTTVAVYNDVFSLLTSGINSVEFQATTARIKLYILPTNGVSATYSDVEVRKITQITPDKSGNNNVGELFTGKAIELDGLNDEIDFGTAQIPIKTISFWIKPLSVSNEGLFYLGLSSFPQFRQISITSGNISATSYFTNFTPYVNNIQTSAVTQDVWQRVVLTFDEWITTTLQIGKVYSSVYGHFAISDVQFYNETWSADDIAFDYANPNKLAIDNPSTSLSVTNLKGYWALSEGDGKLTYDSGTNLEEEEVVDGDFPLPNVNWSLGNGISISNNDMNFTSQSGKYGSQSINIRDGVAYKINFEITTQTSGQLRIFLGANNTVGLVSGLGKKEIIASADTSIDTKIYFGDVFSGSISNVSVREITASDHGGLINGADYVDAQPRIPQLGMQNWSKGSNLFPYSEDFTEWVINPSTSQVVLTPTESAPYGQGDVYSIIMQASEAAAYIRYATNNTTLTSSTHSVWVKQAPTGSATHIRISTNDKNLWNTGTSQKIALTSSWQRLETTDGITGIRFTVIGSADVGGIQDPDCLGKALIYGAQLVEGSSAGNYRFTDGAATSNSTVIANPTIPTQDIFGNAVRDRLNSFNLDGSGWAEVADDADLDFGTGAFSCDGWVKFKHVSTSSINCIYTNGGQIDVFNNFGIGVSSNKIVARVSTTNLDSTTTFSDNVWVYFALTRDNLGACKLYINGNTTPEATATNSANVSNSLSKQIGRDSSSVRYYNDLISDVRVYSKALSSDEIENNYNAGLSAHTN